MSRNISLGLDFSTQSLTAVAVDIDSGETVYQKALDYRANPSFAHFDLNESYILPPAEPGEAFQPVPLFAAALDAILHDISLEWPDLGLAVSDIVVINNSAQQHAYVMLGDRFQDSCKKLCSAEAASAGKLEKIIEPAHALPNARIWLTSNTGEQARIVRERIGGSQKLITLTGSDAPLRFSAFGIRKTAEDHPKVYARTNRIHLLNTFMAAVLAGNPDVPMDFGNACGTSLMDYLAKEWSNDLLEAVAGDLADGGEGLRARLPPLASAITPAGRIAPYFSHKYGLNGDCLIGIGSGDNPQSKVLVDGSLLSLGTSFVIMAETSAGRIDSSGSTNAMYDALDRPFVFGCRTNGALRFDGVRTLHGLAKDDYARSDAALSAVLPGNDGRLFLWQERAESFPVSPKLEPTRINYEQPDFDIDYAGIVESTLAAVYLHSRNFMIESDRIYVTGGPANSHEILKRAAAIWNRNVIPLESGGAALGAAVSGAYARLHADGQSPSMTDWPARFVKTGTPVAPDDAAVEAFHAQGGYLDQYAKTAAALL